MERDKGDDDDEHLWEKARRQTVGEKKVGEKEKIGRVKCRRGWKGMKCRGVSEQAVGSVA